jgi:hypothetical protein
MYMHINLPRQRGCHRNGQQEKGIETLQRQAWQHDCVRSLPRDTYIRIYSILHEYMCINRYKHMC